MGGGDEDGGPMFESKGAKHRMAYKLYACSMLVGICLIWVYRATHITVVSGEEEEDMRKRWVWPLVFGAELWFGFYWILTQSVRWNPVYHFTFKERLSKRYESTLPSVDIFVCTADPKMEPPALVISTVLSLMAYNYPPEKLNVYLSDDGGSELTFYALLEASHFSRHWLPFCKKFKVESRSPNAYFTKSSFDPADIHNADEWFAMKRFYEEMVDKINNVASMGRVPEGLRKLHKGFSEWDSSVTSRDHDVIIQVLLDGRDRNVVDMDGAPLPTLVYISREKRPQHHHNYKAGAMNALIRVSSEISNSPIILNVDCDMYSNNSESIRDALCFFMDELKGHEVGYVQYPQDFDNITDNDLYANSLQVINEIELPGFNSLGGPLYIGTGCFHRRESLHGKKYTVVTNEEWIKVDRKLVKGSVCSLEERAKALATCTYEINTQWGKEMGLKYGCPVEDVLTGLAIQCRGWKSIYFNPPRKGFLGVAPTTLEQTLVQHKRWSEGNLHIFLSKYCPFIYGHGRIKLGLQMSYCIYGLWASNSLPTLCYLTIPSLCLLNGISLFPRISNVWCTPFFYVFIARQVYSLGESVCSGDTGTGWWNMQRMWLLKRITSYLFGTIDAVLGQMGLYKSGFTITGKSADDEELSKRYEKEMMEFNSTSPMFTIIATVALLNLFCLVGAVAKKVVMQDGIEFLEPLFLQFLLCGLVVVINLPIYMGLFIRKDRGRMPTSVTLASVALATLACLLPIY